MDEENKKELLHLRNKADKILRYFQKEGNNIEWALLWMDSLYVSILERNFAKHNKAFIWFKNAGITQGHAFKEVDLIVQEMTSKIYIKD